MIRFASIGGRLRQNRRFDAVVLRNGRQVVLLRVDGVEVADALCVSAKLPETGASGRIDVQDALDDARGVVRDRQVHLEPARVATIGVKALIAVTGDLPRVESSGHVDEDDAQGPDVAATVVVCVPIATFARPDALGTHVLLATEPKILARQYVRRQPEVRQYQSLSLIIAKKVLRLEIAMEDTVVVTVLDRVDHLQEASLEQRVSSFK